MKSTLKLPWGETEVTRMHGENWRPYEGSLLISESGRLYDNSIKKLFKIKKGAVSIHDMNCVIAKAFGYSGKPLSEEVCYPGLEEFIRVLNLQDRPLNKNAFKQIPLGADWKDWPQVDPMSVPPYAPANLKRLEGEIWMPAVFQNNQRPGTPRKCAFFQWDLFQISSEGRMFNQITQGFRTPTVPRPIKVPGSAKSKREYNYYVKVPRAYDQPRKPTSDWRFSISRLIVLAHHRKPFPQGIFYQDGDPSNYTLKNLIEEPPQSSEKKP